MAKADIWMPIYIGDYLSDTMHLSTEQNGAYLLLLLYGWRNNGLIPSDDDSLAQICRMPLELWKNNRAVISRFFQQGEYWTQKRQLEEIEKASNRRDAAKSNGIKGGRPKNNPQVITGLTGGLAKANPEETSLSSPLHIKQEDKSKMEPLKRFQPPTLSEVSEYCRSRGNTVDPEKFVAYYESNGWKVGRNPMKAWKAAITTWEKGNTNGTHKPQQFESGQQRNARLLKRYVGEIGQETGHKGSNSLILPELEANPSRTGSARD